MLTQQVNYPWDPARVLVNNLDSLRREDGQAVSARQAKPPGDVANGLRQRQRVGLAAQGDPLTELAQLGLFQPVLELWLARQHDLKQLFCGSLKVGQQSYLLQ